MTVDSAIAPELLHAEIAAIEDLLVHYEDWRALVQLESRERKGELPAGVASSGIKTLLLDKLATNPLFLRRQTLLKEVEHLTKASGGADAAAYQGNSAGHDSVEDDLTRIRGIDARLERRLNALKISKYEQIAVWEEADVDYFARTLGLETAILDEKWIEQAAVLVAREKLTPHRSASTPITRTYVSSPTRPPVPRSSIDDESVSAGRAREAKVPRDDKVSVDRADVRDTKTNAESPVSRSQSGRPSDDVERVTPAPKASDNSKADSLTAKSTVSPQPKIKDTPATPERVESSPEKPDAVADKGKSEKPEIDASQTERRSKENIEAEKAKQSAGPLSEAPSLATGDAQAANVAPAAIATAEDQKSEVVHPEPSYPLLAPRMPLPASAFAISREAYQQAAAKFTEAQNVSDATSRTETTAQPQIHEAKVAAVWPMPASLYEGAVIAPPGFAVDAKIVPPKPMAAGLFATPVEPEPESELAATPAQTSGVSASDTSSEVNRQVANTGIALDRSPPAQGKDTTQRVPSEPLVAAVSPEPERAGDILNRSLPPLPLTPSAKPDAASLQSSDTDTDTDSGTDTNSGTNTDAEAGSKAKVSAETTAAQSSAAEPSAAQSPSRPNDVAASTRPPVASSSAQPTSAKAAQGSNTTRHASFAELAAAQAAAASARAAARAGVQNTTRADADKPPATDLATDLPKDLPSKGDGATQSAAPISPELAPVADSSLQTRKSDAEAIRVPVPAASSPTEKIGVLTEDGLLAAAAARRLEAQSAPLPPPPIPPPPSPALSSAPPPVAKTFDPAPALPRKTFQVEDTPSARQSAAEARVTIRRAEEAMASAVSRVPAGMDAHKKMSSPGIEKFDGQGYAAYHSEVQQARVEIRRGPPVGTVSQGGAAQRSSTGDGGAAKSPPSHVPDAATRAAAQAAARAAEAATAAKKAAAASLAAQQAVPQFNAPQSEAAVLSEPHEPQSTDIQPAEPQKSPLTMGRFLKALTGQ